MRDAGALLQRAGFALPVADVETVTVRYATKFDLMRDLRAMGETTTLLARRRVPDRRALFVRAAQIYAERFSDPDGRIRATFFADLAVGLGAACLAAAAGEAWQRNGIACGRARARDAEGRGRLITGRGPGRAGFRYWKRGIPARSLAVSDAPMIVIESTATMRLYSTIVAPVSSFRKRLNIWVTRFD